MSNPVIINFLEDNAFFEVMSVWSEWKGKNCFDSNDVKQFKKEYGEKYPYDLLQDIKNEKNNQSPKNGN